MIPSGESKPKKLTLFAMCGAIVFAAAGFTAGFIWGQSRQLKKDSWGDLVFSLHYLSLLKTNGVDKVERSLKFHVYVDVETQNRLGGIDTNGIGSRWLDSWEMASAIHSEMATQVVTVTPQKLMDAVNAQMRTNSSPK